MCIHTEMYVCMYVCMYVWVLCIFSFMRDSPAWPPQFYTAFSLLRFQLLLHSSPRSRTLRCRDQSIVYVCMYICMYGSEYFTSVQPLLWIVADNCICLSATPAAWWERAVGRICATSWPTISAADHTYMHFHTYICTYIHTYFNTQKNFKT